MHILVIEDEAALRETLARRLTDAGYSVDVAAEGEACTPPRSVRSMWPSS